MEAIYEDLWKPYKYLYSIIEKTISDPNSCRVTELDSALRKYKHIIINFLRNPPKNENHRRKLNEGITKGIDLRGQSHLILCKDLVDESIIISDMFNLDEFIALELLCNAQGQSLQHPGLTRGLIAILLYYDGRKTAACALRELFQARNGISWCTEASNEVIDLITSFTQNIVEEFNILSRIIELLEEFDVSKEIALLTKNRALGSPKHRRQVLDLFEETRLALSTALFNWSAQCGLPKSVVLKTMNFLSRGKPTEPTGCIDDVLITTLMAVLYALDASVLQHHEDKDPSVLNLPVMTESNFAQSVFDFLSAEKNWEWENRLNAIIKFAFGVMLASLRQAPQVLQCPSSNVIQYDEELIDEAISLKVFDFLHFYLLETQIIYKNEFFCRRIHFLFTDFIVFVNSKVSELRGKADETARTVQEFFKEGLEPPATLDRNFELLMLSIGKFYSKDMLELTLCNEFWGPMDMQSKSNTSPRSVSLFKFIRMASELLPPILFVPYLKMLSGLSNSEKSARNAFNLLKQGSFLSGSTTISWEHFFGSLARYYTKLRQDQGPGCDTIYRNRVINRSINPQEIEGLCAVLQVVRTVSNHDELARTSICEHPNWMPLQILLGLLSCSVPIKLKADIVLTLAALGQSKETATQLWNSLETSQIISTIPSANIYSKETCGLKMELEQNECRNEVYPLTRAILDLLYSLVSTVIPKNLGCGTRKPGLDPYLTFVTDSIFLKFYNRNYKDIIERWEIGEKCLKLFYHFLNDYEISPDDFFPQREDSLPPGYFIMIHLHTKSEFLNLILAIIHEARHNLDQYHKFPEKRKMEECVLYCLNLIELTLRKQNLFFEAHSVAGSSAFLPGLSRIILDVNPRSGRPDHILNTTKFITYNGWLPSHSLGAIKILNILTRLQNVSLHILGMLTENEDLQTDIRHGFVECLEKDYVINSTVYGNKRVDLEIKEAILDLLKDCLNQPCPNVAHVLLGFDTSRDIRLTQKHGLFHATVNCTNSLVLMLDRNLEAMKTHTVMDSCYEAIIEKAYHLLFMLCYNQWTSNTILRFLRTCNDFLPRHLSAFAIKNLDNSQTLIQISLIMKCIAVDLKIASASNQISRFQSLCEVLVGSSSSRENLPLELNYFYDNSTQKIPTYDNAIKKSKSAYILICHLLECIDFAAVTTSHPSWDYFDTNLIGQILKNCEVKNEQGLKLINIKKLHDILYEELHTVHITVASGQRQLIQQEIDSVLEFALKINTERNKSFSKSKFIEAWAQVTEVMLTCAPHATMTFEIKQDLILDIVERILSKVSLVQIPLELSDILSGTILLLLVTLRYCYTVKPLTTGLSKTTSLRESTHSLTKKFNTLSLKFIVRNIIEWIIISGKVSQRLRINLYTSLVNALHIIKKSSQDNKDDIDSEFFVSRLDESIYFHSQQQNENNELLRKEQSLTENFTSFGDKIIDTLCHDCIGSHDICKMAAISCIDILLDFKSVSCFTDFISKRGYLTHIISSLFNLDSSLCRVLRSTPDNLRTLYIYQSKMALLSRIANSHAGSELLLESKILGVLSTMKVFDMHPELQDNILAKEEQNDEYFPSVMTRFRQILYPALSLCDNIISKLGSDNYSAMLQITHFLLSHGDMIEVVLRAGSPHLNSEFMQELSLITGLIARMTDQEYLSNSDSIFSRDIRAYVHRLRRLMLSLFPRFLIRDKVMKEMNDTKTKMLFLEISSNIMLYCRNVVANGTPEHPIEIIFSPDLSTSVNRLETGVGALENSPSLGLILNQLKGAVEHHHKQKSICDNFMRQSSSISSLDTDDISDQVRSKQDELNHCVFIAENCVFILWIHLDFYMRQSINSSKSIYMHESANADFGSARDSLELHWHKDDIINLKKDLVSIFNETFCSQLSLTWQSGEISDKGFIEALLRRIKYLTQYVQTK